MIRRSNFDPCTVSEEQSYKNVVYRYDPQVWTVQGPFCYLLLLQISMIKKVNDFHILVQVTHLRKVSKITRT